LCHQTVTPKEKSRYKKIVAEAEKIDELMVDLYIQSRPSGTWCQANLIDLYGRAALRDAVSFSATLQSRNSKKDCLTLAFSHHRRTHYR